MTERSFLRDAWDAARARAALEALGYDVEREAAWGEQDGGSLTARRERGGRAYLVVLDAGGRIRAEITVTLDEHARDAAVGDTPLRVTDVTQAFVTVSGTLASMDDLAPVLAALDGIATPGLPAVSPAWTDLPPPP